MTSIWLLLITIAIIGCMAIIVFTSAAKRYSANKPVTCWQHNKHYDRRKNQKPIYYPFTDSEGNLVTSNRRNHKERRLTP
ncbi:hypothetical protein [Spartinivicinus ruber]|uniref:hypothetical protein n=1 Tax=Spartinivicinus ruber TaxID=2683272 RepID=UPI0013D3EE63|nr:hypothetical protein [Spartinivicinus ruber]